MSVDLLFCLLCVCLLKNNKQKTPPPPNGRERPQAYFCSSMASAPSFLVSYICP